MVSVNTIGNMMADSPKDLTCRVTYHRQHDGWFPEYLTELLTIGNMMDGSLSI